MKSALLVCGALAAEVIALRDRHGWEADVWALPAQLHMTPRRIAPSVAKRLRGLMGRYARVVVVYGDCGTGGALDELLAEFGVERVPGPHCYEMYAGSDFAAMMAEEPGTFYLTDFLARHFEGLVIKELGLDHYPQLRGDYFGNYRRVIHLAQRDDGALTARAQAAAARLGLPLEVRRTGMGALETRLLEIMQSPSVPPAKGSKQHRRERRDQA